MSTQQVVIEYLQFHKPIKSFFFNYILPYWTMEIFKHFVLFENSFKICLVVWCSLLQSYEIFQFQFIYQVSSERDGLVISVVYFYLGVPTHASGLLARPWRYIKSLDAIQLPTVPIVCHCRKSLFVYILFALNSFCLKYSPRRNGCIHAAAARLRLFAVFEQIILFVCLYGHTIRTITKIFDLIYKWNTL